MKKKLKDLQGKTEESAIIVGDFNCLLSTLNRSRQKMSKDIEYSNTVNQFDLIDI